MMIKCSECGKSMQRKVGKYKYLESGLNNVFLENVDLYQCGCGTSYASIFRVPRLNELIAKTILKKRALLSGKEIRFLRKHVHVSSRDFAKMLHIDKTTLPKWEGGSQRQSKPHDLLIRKTYMTLKGIRVNEQRRILYILKDVQLAEPDVIHLIRATRQEEDYIVEWKLMPGVYPGSFDYAWVSPYQPPSALLSTHRFATSQSHIESGVIFSSQKVLSTKAGTHGIMLE